MIRALTQFHENPKVLAYTETITGRCVVWALASALLLWHSVYAPWSPLGGYLVMMIWVLPLVTGFPAYRRSILSVASILAILDYFHRRGLPGLETAVPQTWSIYHFESLRFAMLGIGMLLCLYVFFVILRHFSNLPRIVQRHPILTFHLSVCAAVSMVLVFQLPEVVTAVLPIIAWRLSYLIQFASRGQAANSKFSDHLFYLWPVYGPTGIATPIGKGLEYLSRHEATDSSQLARSQLAGLKLLIVAFVWEIVLRIFDAVIYGDTGSLVSYWIGGITIGLPKLYQMMNRNVIDVPATVVVANIYLDLIRMSLLIAIYGHLIVGCVRLLGFQIFRHTYRPLLATSIIEFWGRWSYYYKELLTEFFFYPTYLRSSSLKMGFRLFLAVFAAAFVGNTYFDVLSDANLLLGPDKQIVVARWASRTVYCFLLATGIWISMLRQQHIRRLAPLGRKRWSQIRKAFLVCSFYAWAHVWATYGSDLGPVDRFQWLLRAIL